MSRALETFYKLRWQQLTSHNLHGFPPLPVCIPDVSYRAMNQLLISKITHREVVAEIGSGMATIVTLTSYFLLATQLASSGPSCHLRAVFGRDVALHLE